MKKTSIALIIATSFILIGCPNQDEFQPDKELMIFNNTDQELMHFTTFSVLTDTVLPEVNPYINFDFDIFTIAPNSSKIIKIDSDLLVRRGSLHIHLFSKEILIQASWERIRDEYLVLRRHDLTLEDLEAMDWVVEYP